MRLSATLLDGILLLIADSFFALFLLIASQTFPIITFEIGITLFIIIGFLYNPLMESSKSQGSLGKQVFNLKVVDKEGERLTFIMTLTRLMANCIACVPLFVGITMIAFTDKRGMHDMMTDTYVVKNKQR